MLNNTGLEAFELRELRIIGSVLRRQIALRVRGRVFEALLEEEVPWGERGIKREKDKGTLWPSQHWSLGQRRRNPLWFPFLLHKGCESISVNCT